MATSFPPSSLVFNPFLSAAADKIRFWRSKLNGLSSLALEPELQSIMGSLEGEEVFITNELHKSIGLRKIHLEIAVIGSDLQILHCIFFPDPRFDIPIFGADIVVSSYGITAAIIDLSPVSTELPEKVIYNLEKLTDRNFSQKRELPEWGTIFSPYVQFIRPNGKEEENLFLEIVDDYLRVLLDVLVTSSPQESNSPSTIERHQAQVNYCNQQKLNDKTKAVLSKAFSPHWADRYIEKLLFDIPPSLEN